ncbi:hypothetical protein TVAG_495830 [Trichomonas vaginalis G3]|uniref:Uncharacterized protein n=1 Tax=Trichomonas vaginalis (strain ATCC PRA-98 / G3) TaxID=412133 RepID=A2DVM2_TRIV3|nr:hypothetical protein TVAGG3_0275970 [Trichomonas vaginalis G3]EAY15564.1 hypothetical protein TVAG_495830 [Trichomonas vaginalis G3]KAI5526210.1 hypothetical protein TVAGG3_0275970 [Trichomonas vaginalis G3]|eukprot:XP_001327787.1 hypothetical protein [Trichomonas vaginalis G3]
MLLITLIQFQWLRYGHTVLDIPTDKASDYAILSASNFHTYVVIHNPQYFVDINGTDLKTIYKNQTSFTFKAKSNEVTKIYLDIFKISPSKCESVDFYLGPDDKHLYFATSNSNRGPIPLKAPMKACLIFANPFLMSYECDMTNLNNHMKVYEYDNSLRGSSYYYSAYEYETLILEVSLTEPMEYGYVGIKPLVKDKSLVNYCEWKNGPFSACDDLYLMENSNEQCSDSSKKIDQSWEYNGNCIKLNSNTKEINVSPQTTCFETPEKSVVVFHPTIQMKKYFGKIEMGSNSYFIFNETNIIGGDFHNSGKILIKSIINTKLPISVFDMSWKLPQCEFIDFMIGPMDVLIGTSRMSITGQKYQYFIEENQTICYISLNAKTDNMVIDGSSIKLKSTFYTNKGETPANISNLPEDFMVSIYCEDGNAIAAAGYEFKNNGNEYQYNGIIGNATGRNPSIKVDNYKYKIIVDSEISGDDSNSDSQLYYIIGGSIAAVIIIIIIIIIICCCCCKKNKRTKDESIEP